MLEKCHPVEKAPNPAPFLPQGPFSPRKRPQHWGRNEQIVRIAQSAGPSPRRLGCPAGGVALILAVYGVALILAVYGVALILAV